MKKIILIMMVAVLTLSVVGCSSTAAGENENEVVEKEPFVEGTLEEIMEKVYGGVEVQLPNTMQTLIDGDNMSYFLGSDEIALVEGLASEPMMSSQAHSVVLLRAEEGADIDAMMTVIKTSVDPRKWICVGVEEDEVIVDHIGDLVILIMDHEAEALHESFLKLAE